MINTFIIFAAGQDTYDYARPNIRVGNIEKHNLDGYLTPRDVLNSNGFVYDTERYLIPKEVMENTQPSNSAQTQIVSTQQLKCSIADENIYDTAMEVLFSEPGGDVIYQVLDGPDPNGQTEENILKDNCEAIDDTAEKLYDEVEGQVTCGHEEDGVYQQTEKLYDEVDGQFTSEHEEDGVYQQLRENSFYESLHSLRILLEYEHGEIAV